MSLDVPQTPAEPVAYEGIGLGTNWGEHAVATVAVSLGVLSVAVIAVLMGMV